MTKKTNDKSKGNGCNFKITGSSEQPSSYLNVQLNKFSKIHGKQYSLSLTSLIHFECNIIIMLTSFFLFNCSLDYSASAVSTFKAS